LSWRKVQENPSRLTPLPNCWVAQKATAPPAAPRGEFDLDAPDILPENRQTAHPLDY